MNRSTFLTKWILANGTGMAFGFLFFLNILFFLGFGFEFDLYWSDAAVKDIENAEQLLRRGLVIGLPLAGAIFTSFQAIVLRDFSIHLGSWIFAGPIGFVVPLLIIWPLTSIWGDIPGPVEPFTIVGGGLIGVAIFQWLTLRRKGMGSKRWFLLWVAGLPLGMVAFMAIYTLIDMVYSVSWAGEVGLIGFSTGSCAAAISGRALFRTISAAKSPNS